MTTPGAPRKTEQSFLRGALLLLAAIFLFDVMGAIIKYLGQQGELSGGTSYAALQLAMFRNVFGLIPCIVVLMMDRDWHAAGRPLLIRQWRLGLGRGLMIAFAQFCFYTALVIAAGVYVPVASLHDWGWLLAMGAVGGTAVLTIIAAYRSAEPGTLAPFEYFGIPFSFVIGFYVFAEAPFERLFPGALLIVAGGLLIVWRERRRKATVGP